RARTTSRSTAPCRTRSTASTSRARRTGRRAGRGRSPRPPRSAAESGDMTLLTTPTPGRRITRRLGFSQRLGRWDVKLSPYLYISPFFILFAITGLFPLAYTAFVSVHEWNLLGGQGDFVGLANYADVLAQPTFWRSLVNTFSIFVFSAFPQLALALLIAALLDQNLRSATFWRMGVLVPYVVAPVAVSMIFGRLFADQYGLINELLGLVGLDPIAWHGDRVA